MDSAEIRNLLETVSGREVQFATMRPPGSPFATLDRRIVVTSPPELAELAKVGQVHVLQGLIESLRDPSTAWAAEVVLAAMTRREEKEIEAFSSRPDEWWESMGRSAHERWSKWVAETGGRLRWDASTSSFVESEP